MHSGLRQVTRRDVLRAIGLGAGAALLAACAPAPQTAAVPVTAPPAPTSGPTAAAAAPKPTAAPVAAVVAVAPTAPSKPVAAQPKAGGTLRVGVPNDIVSLEGIVRGGLPYESTWLIYDRLIKYDLQSRPQPLLAETWEVTPDYKQVKFNLRRDVQWHTGREFTSDDVKYNINRVRDPKIGFGDFAAPANWWSSIETPDKYSVIFTSEESRPAMFDFFQNINLGDQQTLEGPDAKTKAVGTGPFRFVEWAQGERIVIEKNPNYWQTGKPYLDRIETTIRTDIQALLAAFETEAVDLIRTQQFRDVARLKNDPRFQVIIHPAAGAFFELAFLTTQSPFDNKSVRQGFNWAIDRQRIAEQSLFGFAQPVDLQWAPSSPAYDESKNKVYTFNLDKAKALLAQAGVAGLTTDIIVQPSLPLNTLGSLEVYQADLAKIGVTLNIKTMDPAAWAAAVLGNSYNGMYATGDASAHLSPVNNLSGPTWRVKPNNTNFDSPEWVDLQKQIAVEADPAKQKVLYARLNDYILDQSFAMPIATNPQILVGTTKLKGLEPTLYGGFLFTEAWLDS